MRNDNNLVFCLVLVGVEALGLLLHRLHTLLVTNEIRKTRVRRALPQIAIGAGGDEEAYLAPLCPRVPGVCTLRILRNLPSISAPPLVFL